MHNQNQKLKSARSEKPFKVSSPNIYLCYELCDDTETIC